MIGTVAKYLQDPGPAEQDPLYRGVAGHLSHRIPYSDPGVQPEQAIQALADTRDTDSPLGRAAEYLQIFTGGTLSQSSLFGLGIMPYITASIILMLLGEVIPSLKKLRQEGQTGHKKIQEYTRYLTVLICVIQALMYMQMLMRGEQIDLSRDGAAGDPPGRDLDDRRHHLPDVARRADRRVRHRQRHQLDHHGRHHRPHALGHLSVVHADELPDRRRQPEASDRRKVLFLGVAFVFVVAGAILITQAQRRIPIQQAKQMRGRRMYGGSGTTCRCGSTTAA